MNKYNIELHAKDCYGLKFLEQVVMLSNMGATIDKNYPNKNTFPNKVMLSLETDQFIQDDMVNGMRVHIVELQYTQDMLETMSWEDFKAAVAEKGVKGKERATMMRKYFQAIESGKQDESSGEDE